MTEFYWYLHKLILWRAKAKVRRLQRQCGTNYVSVTLRDEIGELLLDVRDRGITEQLLASRIRELEDVRCLRQLLSEVDLKLILDIGANIGFFALIEARSNAPRIVCCEPVDSTYRLLQMNLALNHLEDKVVTRKVAIGDRVGEVEMQVPKECNFSSIEPPKTPRSGARIEKVAMVTLEALYKDLDLCDRDRVLIRCDIEGYELPLVRSNHAFLRTLTNSWFVMEFHSHLLGLEKSREFLDQIYEIGFAVQFVSVHRPHHLTSLSGWLETLALRDYEARLGCPLGVTHISGKEEFCEKFLKGDFVTSRTVHLFMHKP